MLDYEPIKKESYMLRHMPVIFAIANVLISLPLALWGVIGTLLGWRLGDKIAAPLILLLLIDFPCGFIPLAMLEQITDYSKTLASSEVAQAIAITASLLIVGAVWYYALGRALQRFLRRGREARD